MKNRFNEHLTKEITAQVAYDLIKFNMESAEVLVDCYLKDDVEGLFDNIKSWVESAEKAVLDEINTQLNEDSYKQAEQGFDDE